MGEGGKNTKQLRTYLAMMKLTCISSILAFCFSNGAPSQMMLTPKLWKSESELLFTWRS